MKTLIAGSRSYAKQRKEESLESFIERVERNKSKTYQILDRFKDTTTTVISGLAKGPDRWGQQWGDDNNIPVDGYMPDWETHGMSAGFKRNKEMVHAADRVIAIWDGVSKGTMHTIDYARENGLEVYEFRGILENG